jgi:hypothetical protein
MQEGSGKEFGAGSELPGGNRRRGRKKDRQFAVCPEFLRATGEIAALSGQTSTGRARYRCRMSFIEARVIAEKQQAAAEERGVRRDPALCNARFPDDADI